MASIAKWFKRAKAALLSGDMKTWEGTKNMIGGDLRRQLESEFGVGAKTPKAAAPRREVAKKPDPVVAEEAPEVKVVEKPAPAARRRRRTKKSAE